MKHAAYLARLGVASAGPPDLALLSELQAAHLFAVPFENLSVIRQEPIVLEEERLVDKIVERRRGGFCYELNGSFAWLLRQLGFSVSHISARVFSASRQDFGPEFDHLALLVQLDEHYLVDVGFGDSVRQPLPLPGGEANDVSGHYRIRRLASEADEYHLERASEDGWVAQYAFTTMPHQLAEYGEMCHYHAHSPESHFTRQRVCTLATPTGRVTLTPDALIVTTADEKQRLPVASAAEYDRLLAEHFGLCW
jgi:N-hydroxyarylamine O-acetyltransferase